MSEVINKVAASGLVTIDLEEFYPEGDRTSIDIATQLWQGLALREKDFREWIKTSNWEVYRDKYVALYCSADAIIPMWAYMLVASRLQDVARRVVFGKPERLEEVLFSELISRFNPEEFRDKRLIVKGCSKHPVPASAYTELVLKLQPVAKSIMFGEPCSTVPVYKKS